ncbi:MAG: AarF/UbiB family protein [Polyangia bacterium]
MQLRFLARALIITLLSLLTLARFCAGWLALLVIGKPAEARQAWAGRCLARLMRRLGATFVKLGQILSTRPDLLPKAMLRELESLQDHVGPFSFDALRETIEQDFSEPLETLYASFDRVPLASASVAQVHAAVLHDGRRVAVKVRRPDIERLVDFDLGAMRLGGKLLELVPSLSLLSPVESIDEFGRGIRMQLDFTIEADNNRRFRTNFAGDPDVVFPELVERLCSMRVLTMELIDGEKVLAYAKVGADPKRLAAIGFRVILKMIFIDGLVHADLHPGNLFVTRAHKLALLDLGLVGELDAEHRLGLARYFAAFAAGDGVAMAQIMTSLASADARRTVRDYPGFERAVQVFAQRHKGQTLGEIQISVVFLELMEILRHHRVRANPTFTLVNIAIMMTEGIGKQLDPSVDLIGAAAPFFAHMGL